MPKKKSAYSSLSEKEMDRIAQAAWKGMSDIDKSEVAWGAPREPKFRADGSTTASGRRLIKSHAGRSGSYTKKKGGRILRKGKK